MQPTKQRPATLVKNVRSMISIDPDIKLHSKHEIEQTRRSITDKVVKVVEFSKRMNIEMTISKLHNIVLVNQIFRSDDTLQGTYSNGTIKIKITGHQLQTPSVNTNSSLEQVVAHTMFHAEQDRLGRFLGDSQTQKSYVECGAYFFETAFQAWKSGFMNDQVDASLLVFPNTLNPNELANISSEFMARGAEDRLKILVGLLRLPNSKDDPQNHLIYNGSNFAKFVLMLNDNDVVRTIQLLLNSNLAEAARILVK